MVIEIISLSCLAAALVFLVWMSVIDLKYWILPDELNAALGLCGICFHIMTAYRFLSIGDMLIGAAAAAGILLLIRFFANRHYGRDSLGLGDVKLLGAAGLWLGLDGVMQAITIGAFAGLVHGAALAAFVSLKNKTPFSVRQLAIPAGPGFAVGIFAAGALLFHSYVTETIHALLP